MRMSVDKIPFSHNVKLFVYAFYFGVIIFIMIKDIESMSFC